MKRIAAWAALAPRRNHVMIARYPQPSAAININRREAHHVNHFAAAAGAPPIDADAGGNDRYVVSRNGILLPWRQVRQQFRPLDNDDDCGSNSVQDTNLLLPDLDAPMDASALLQILPRGAYTTARTVGNGTRIYQFDYHVKRLAQSAQSILETITGEDKEKLMAKSNHPRQHHRTPSQEEISELNIVDEAWEREMALECIRSTLDAFCARYHVEGCKVDGNHCEFRIVLLATWERKGEVGAGNGRKHPFQSALYCHVGVLPQSLANDESTKKNIRVLIHGHGRENALAKDSKWVLDRKKLVNGDGDECSLEARPAYEEIILISDNGELLEGTQTNFYVATEDSVVTADEGILYGSVRDSVLRVCRENGISVELRAPTLNDLKCASGVFISSTSRLVMPVHEVVLGDLLSLNEADKKSDVELPTSYCYPNCETTERIRKLVRRDVETHSTPVY